MWKNIQIQKPFQPVISMTMSITIPLCLQLCAANLRLANKLQLAYLFQCFISLLSNHSHNMM